MKRIFFSLRGGFGDIILMSPVLRGFRRLFPDARLTLLSDPKSREFALRYGWFDEVLIYERGLKNGWTIYKTLREQDGFVIFDIGERIARLAWLARVPVRAGVRGRKFRHLTHEADMSSWNPNLHYQPENAAEFIQRSLGLDLGAVTDLNGLELPTFSEAEKNRVDALLAGAGLNGEPLLLIAPFTAVEFREWPLAHYQQLIALLAAELKTRPVVLSGPGKRELDLAATLHGCVNLAGQTSFMEMSALIARARLLVGSCSGHAHVAAALRRPAVILYGASLPERWAGRYGTLALSLRLPCSGCVDLGGHRAICAERPCMTALSVEMVFKASLEQWRRSEAS